MLHIRRRRPTAISCDHLEARHLLSVTAHLDRANSPVNDQRIAAVVRKSEDLGQLAYDFTKLTMDIRQMQFGSHVTAGEVDQLNHDIRALGLSNATVAFQQNSPYEASSALYDLAYRVDYAFIEAGFSPAGWANKEAAITSDLAQLGLNVAPSNVDRLITDLQAIAQSAGVSVAENQQYWTDETAVMADMNAMTDPPFSMDPFHVFSHELHGFVHAE